MANLLHIIYSRFRNSSIYSVFRSQFRFLIKFKNKMNDYRIKEKTNVGMIWIPLKLLLSGRVL